MQALRNAAARAELAFSTDTCLWTRAVPQNRAHSPHTAHQGGDPELWTQKMGLIPTEPLRQLFLSTRMETRSLFQPKGKCKGRPLPFHLPSPAWLSSWHF